MCILFYINYTSIKILKEKKDFMCICLGHLLAPEDSKSYSLFHLGDLGEKYGDHLNKALQILLLSLSLPHHSPAQFPRCTDTWSELTNHVCVNSSVIIVWESVEGASLDLIWLMKFSLDHPQHFSIAGLKAHLPWWGKRCTGARWESERQAADASGTAGGSRRAEAQDKGLTDKDEQTFAASSLWRTSTYFSTAGPLPNLCSPKKPQPTSSCPLALCFMAFMRSMQRLTCFLHGKNQVFSSSLRSMPFIIPKIKYSSYRLNSITEIAKH